MLFFDKFEKVLFSSNSNLWRSYSIIDLKLRKKVHNGSFESSETWKFGTFQSCIYGDLIISTGAGFNLETRKDYSQIRLSRLNQNNTIDALAIRLFSIYPM